MKKIKFSNISQEEQEHFKTCICNLIVTDNYNKILSRTERRMLEIILRQTY